MKKRIIYSVLVGFVVSACQVQMQSYSLKNEYATTLHYDEISIQGDDSGAEEDAEKSELGGVPALSFYGGDLKRGGIWWASEGIALEKGDVFILDIDSVNTNPFGATFPPIDLVKAKVAIKITARAVNATDSLGKILSPDAPTLFLQVDDAAGYRADAKRPSNKIEYSDDFKEYYFDLTDKDIYMQSEPKHKVNGTLVNSVKFFVNSGLPLYSGQIQIKEIKVVPAQQN